MEHLSEIFDEIDINADQTVSWDVSMSAVV